MSSILDPEPDTPEPIDVWIMTASDNDRGDVEVGLTALGGSIQKFDKYYLRTIKVHGIVRHIRGRMEVLIRSEWERARLEERLQEVRCHPRVRRVSTDELAAVAALEADPNNWKHLGGIQMFKQPPEEDLPDYPPTQILRASPASKAPQPTEATQKAITDMQNEGGPVHHQES